MSAEIIGYACLAPGADSPRELFQLLKDERCVVTEVPRDRWDQSRYWHPEPGTLGKTYSFAAGVIDDPYAFDHVVFGLSRREASALDPQQRLALNLTWRALEDANIDPGALRRRAVGVYIGASGLDHANLIVEDLASGNPYFMSGNTLSVVSNRISHVFDLSGPSMTIDTACSSSLVALDQAVKAIESGAIDTAIVGGVNLLTHPLPFIGFAQARMLSPEGLCRAYDDSGAGYVRAEGGAVMILRRSDVAACEGDRSHATVVASATNAAGRTNGISLPSPQAQAELLAGIYREGGVDPSRLVFVEGHGTGTRVGDPSELWSIGTVIGRNRSAPVPIGSIKTNIGHTEPASGIFGLLKAVLSLEHGFFPASLHFETPNRDIDLQEMNIHVASKGLKLLSGGKRRFAGVNSFGFGGTNAHVVVADPPKAETAGADLSTAKAFMVSAHSEAALKALVADYRRRLDGVGAVADKLVRSTGHNRARLGHRFVVVPPTLPGVSSAITAFLDGERSGLFQVGRAAGGGKLAFAFAGNGSQWAGMGIDAYRNDRHFKNRFDEIAALFRLHSQVELVELLFDEHLEPRLADTRIAQPLLFAVQAALSDCLHLRGLVPSAVFGHSVGEVAAAYAAGALSLSDAVRVIAIRALHQHHTAGWGKMAAAMMSPDAAWRLMEKEGLTDLHVAAFNAPESITVCGPSEEIERFVVAASAGRRAVTLLDIDYPFHHPMIEPHRDGFLADLPDLAPETTHTPFISSVTGEIISGGELQAAYWWRNLREPVLFAKAAAAAFELGCTTVLEIGPRPVLKNYLVDATRAAGKGSVLSTLSRTKPGGAANPLDAIFAGVLAQGGEVDRCKVFAPRVAAVAHPPLPFDESSPKLVKTSDAINLYGREQPASRLCGWRLDPAGTAWKNHLDANLFPDLAEHKVEGKSILPATGFLEIAVAVAQEYFQVERVEVSNLELLRPLELKHGAVTEMSTVISPETGDIEIRSRARLEEETWTVNARARCRPADGFSAFDEPDFDLGDSSVAIPAERVYEVASHFGFGYGPKLRLVDEANAFGNDRIAVTLKAPARPTNPYIGYAVNPMSADAALHGLVAMFDRFGEASSDTPFIPVRIGRIEVKESGVEVSGARVRIGSVSPHSIKADIALLGAGGGVVARLTDIRLRRGALRQRATLEAASYHHETVPHFPSFATENSPAILGAAKSWMEGLGDREQDPATLLLGAAAYRVAFDVAEAVCDHTRTVTAIRLAEDDGRSLFRRLCLQHLSAAGIAEETSSGWKLVADCTIPSFAELFELIYRDDSERVVEAIALNDARQFGLGSDDGPDSPAHAATVGEATIEHLAMHAASARAAIDIVEAGVRASIAATVAPTIVEFGFTSAALSRRLIDLAQARNGRYVLIEDREAIRNVARYQFAASVNVEIIGSDSFDASRRSELVVSASGELHAHLLEEAAAGFLLRRLIASGGTFIGAFQAPSAQNDIMNGQRKGWLSQEPSGRVAGRLANERKWLRTLEDLGVRKLAVRRTGAGCTDIVVAIGGSGDAATSGQRHSSDEEGPAATEASGSQRLVWLPAVTDIAAGLNDVLDHAARAQAVLVYDAGPPLVPDGPRHLQDCVLQLSAIAMRLNAIAEEGARAPCVVVLLDGGAPTAVGSPGERAVSAAHAGLWTFLRALRNEYAELRVLSVDANGLDRRGASFLRRLDHCIDTSGCVEWIMSARDECGVAELRVVPGPQPASEALTSSFEAATLAHDANTSIVGLGWSACERPRPGRRQVLIEVAATGLNFRDVMWAMGLLPEEALEDGFAGATIGMECSGSVVGVGEDVRAIVPGDRVMAFAPAAFSTHVAVDEKAVVKLPDAIAFAAGATVPVAFLTAQYALGELARVQPGESVLIHGGAGGVGLAALQIARQSGARVFATAGTEEKRALLRLLGAERVFDSRSLAFAREVMDATNGEGVDVVLNSLFADAMELSIGVLRPFGRFLELGKRDYYFDRKIGLRPFRRNISYHGIDADQLLLADARRTRRLMKSLSDQFSTGKLHPLPHRVFGADEIKSAFRLMQGSGHIGKIVVTPPRPRIDAVRRPVPAALKMDPEGVHLVVGGIGGFGLEAADWLVERGARRIALCSRRGVPDDATSRRMNRWKARGVETVVLACDARSRADVEKMLTLLRAAGPLKTIIHAAMVLDDALLPSLSPERNQPVIETKALAAEHLDALTEADELDNFILFSSVTTMVGNVGQANYVAANGYLEGLARRRRLAGKPALAIGFGPISDVGVLASQTDLRERLAQRIGHTGMTARDALRQVEAYIAADTGCVDAASVVIANLDWTAVSRLAVTKSSLFDPVARMQHNAHEGATLGHGDLGRLLADKSPGECEAILFGIVAEELATALQIPASSISSGMSLRDVGLDSLMALELAMSLEKRIGMEVQISGLSETATIGTLVGRLLSKVGRSETTKEPAGGEAFEALAARHSAA